MSAVVPNKSVLSWRKQLPAACARQQPDLARWLRHPGLLTRRLKHACGSGFHLQVLGDEQSGTLVSGPTVRRVVLWCDEAACIYAETHAPASTLRAHPWLLELGSDPLGESLASRTDATRTGFSFVQVESADLPLDVAGLVTRTCWARRSDFEFPRGRVSVAEVFLDGIDSLPAQRDR